jgi:hypothetical protein
VCGSRPCDGRLSDAQLCSPLASAGSMIQDRRHSVERFQVLNPFGQGLGLPFDAHTLDERSHR